jgi:hypothetical protein
MACLGLAGSAQGFLQEDTEETKGLPPCPLFPPVQKGESVSCPFTGHRYVSRVRANSHLANESVTLRVQKILMAMDAR